MLKKVGLAAAVFTASLNAQWFVGLEYPMISNMSTRWSVSGDYDGSGNDDFSYQPLKIKVGAGTPGDWNMNIYYQTAKRKYSGFTEENSLNEFGYDIRKEFGLEGVPGLAPYVQGGVAYGWTKFPVPTFSGYDSFDRSTLSFKAGIGVAYLFTAHFQALIGLDYKSRLLENMYFDANTEEEIDSGTQLYIGLNFWFGEDAHAYQENSYSEPAPATEPASEPEVSPSVNIE